MDKDRERSPVFVGGVGGSGTRVIAQILLQLGFFLGNKLNESQDTLEVGEKVAGLLPLVKQQTIKASLAGPDYPLRYDAATAHLIRCKWQDFRSEMEQNFRAGGDRYINWGVKSPPIFHFMKLLSEVIRPVKYIHVMRHGVDMAFSQNQNQVKDLGWRFGLNADSHPTPRDSLDYWILANQQALRDAAKYNIDLLVVDFDRLCAEPTPSIRRLLAFLQFSDESGDTLAKVIRPPSTIGRRHHCDQTFVTDADREALRTLGFEP